MGLQEDKLVVLEALRRLADNQKRFGVAAVSGLTGMKGERTRDALLSLAQSTNFLQAYDTPGGSYRLRSQEELDAIDAVFKKGAEAAAVAAHPRPKGQGRPDRG